MLKILLASTLAVPAAFLLDQLFGDPETSLHPICLIGNLISRTEKRLRSAFPTDPAGELKAGRLMVLLVAAVCAAVPALLLALLYRRDLLMGILAEAVICYFMLAEKTLEREGNRVARELEDSGLPAARTAVARIVGRDTENLDEQGVLRAAVESIAENFSDGVLAPLFYMTLGGAVLGTVYKGINTMDSMTGYRNEKYLYFGRCAARTDDAVNFIPARIAGLLMAAAAVPAGLDAGRALKVFLRDRRNHPSPNSAHTEAAAAGALGVRLGGPTVYFGRIHDKPYIGDDLRPLETADIQKVNLLVRTASVLGLLLFCLLRAGILLTLQKFF